jgi:hypothetical protein
MAAVGFIFSALAAWIVYRFIGQVLLSKVKSPVTGGIHRSVDMILPRILELKDRNRKKLESGEVTMKQIIAVAGTRVMAGVW